MTREGQVLLPHRDTGNARCRNNAWIHKGTFEYPVAGLDAGGLAVPLKRFKCVICGLEYDEARGWPEDGIPPRTRWEEVPLTWTCPECGAVKGDFEMVEVV